MTTNDLQRYKQKIEDAKTSVPLGHKDYEWMDGFNHGLDWAIRILDKDKSASWPTIQAIEKELLWSITSMTCQRS